VNVKLLVAGVLSVLAMAGCDNSRARFGPHLKDLKDPDPFTRASAAHFLGTIGVDAAAICLPALEDALNDEDEVVRVNVAEAILKIDSRRKDRALPILIKELESKDSLARRTSVIVLGSIGPAAESAVPG
jgi:HEAT repeat protein